MGFDTETPLYHGTRANFDAFDVGQGSSQEAGLGVHLGTSDQANDIIRARGIEASRFGEFSQGGNVMPVYVRGRRYLRLEDDKTWTPDQLATQLAWLDEPITVQWRDPFNKTTEDVRRALQDAGYDGIIYRNQFEGPGQDSVIVFDPSNIRSRFAAFDPARSNSRDLLAGIAAPVAVGGALSQRERRRH